jgi:hypothetical protein
LTGLTEFSGSHSAHPAILSEVGLWLEVEAEETGLTLMETAETAI